MKSLLLRNVYHSIILTRITAGVLLLMSTSCNSFLEVDKLKNEMLAEQVFETETMANSAILGLYRMMRGAIPTPLIELNSIYSNEIMPYNNTLSNTYYTQSLQPEDNTLPWNRFYSVIYAANNAIEKLETSSNIPAVSKATYIAEAKFMRALCHFYMLNLYGDIPLVLTPDVKINSQIPRSDITRVYDQITTDLIDAKTELPNDYAHAAGEKVRANKWAAAALLARVYLYQNNFSNAESEADEIIASSQYSLLSGAAGIFNRNNSEAIFQFANNNTDYNNAATSFIYANVPIYVCTPTLLNAFEIGDQRKSTWIYNTTYAGQTVSVPYKFTSTAASPPEYNTIMRLAEIYLIRAESRAMRNDFGGCVDDVNLIRLRHGGLNIPLPDPTDHEEAINIILHERQVELFTECGHRFFDLKRTGRIDAVMLAEKTEFWKSTAALYPIPLTERQRNPSLTQNLGYE